ncbi:MAG TPA: protein kinase [Pirellulales bacterium]|nr:protein kinase [Pirellulales bacterium]
MAFDAYHRWLGIPPAEQPPNHYRLLGIGLFEVDPDVIESAADRQMAHVRTFQAGQHSTRSQEILNELAAAKICLLEERKRAAYDAELIKHTGAAEPPKTSNFRGSAHAEPTPARGNGVAKGTIAGTACPDVAHLADFALGKLIEPAAEMVARHLHSCERCRQNIADARPNDARNLDQTFIDRDSADALETTIDLAEPPRRGFGKRSPPLSPRPELVNHSDYEIVRELGHGGMGVVYLARNRTMDRLEVLKVLNQSLLETPGALERFQQEIRSAAKLSHVNIVTAYAVLRLDDSLAFAMEYVPGQDLAQVVQHRGALRVANAAYYAHQAALGLQHAHEKGMVHRDIKPNNLMLAVDGKKHIVKILDFGLAKATSEKADDTSLTKSGQILGTPDYLAPEQSRDAQRADIRADIYGLGCTLYFLLTGKRPFTASSLCDVLDAHQNRTATPLDEVRPEAPRALATVVAKMMAKSPGDRYQTPLEVARALLPFFKPSHRAAAPAEVAPGQRPVPVLEPPAMVDGAMSVAQATSPIWQFSTPAALPRAVPMATPVYTSAFDTAIDFETPLLEAAPPAMPHWTLYLVTCVGAMVIMLFLANIVRHRPTIEAEPIARATVPPVAVDRVAPLDFDETANAPPLADAATEPASIPEAAPSKPAANRFPCRITKYPDDWSIVGDELVQSSLKHWPSLKFGEAGAGDYDFSVELMKTAGNDVVVLNFGGDVGKVFFYGLGANRNRQHDTGSVQSGKISRFRRRNASLTKDRWYLAEVRVRGEKYECFLDGERIFSATADGLAVRKWGLSANKTTCRFRNILVKAPDGTVLVEGLPDLESARKSATADSTDDSH